MVAKFRIMHMAVVCTAFILFTSTRVSTSWMSSYVDSLQTIVDPEAVPGVLNSSTSRIGASAVMENERLMDQGQQDGTSTLRIPSSVNDGTKDSEVTEKDLTTPANESNRNERTGLDPKNHSLSDFAMRVPLQANKIFRSQLRSFDPDNTRVDFYPVVKVEDIAGDAPHFVTVVTGYFRVDNAKHKSEEYDEWMSNFLSMQDAMVVFTSHDMVERVQELRSHAIDRTLVIPMNLNDTMVVQEFGYDFWTRQKKLDREDHAVELLIVWSEKVNFIIRAVDMNPFNSSWFQWVDMGYFRDERFRDKVMTRVLPAELVIDFQEENETQRTLVLEPQTYVIGGGYIGGFPPALREWHNEYYTLMRSFAKQGRFCGKEQDLFFQMYREKGNEIFRKIEPRSGLSVRGWDIGDVWFFMGPFLGGKVSVNELSVNGTEEYRLSQMIDNPGMNAPPRRKVTSSPVNESLPLPDGRNWPMVRVSDLEAAIDSSHGVTLVTAYFQVNSKHTSREYEKWISLLLSLQDTMIIYTSPDLVNKFETLRAHAMDRTHIVSMHLNETKMLQKYGWDFWASQEQMDPERAGGIGHTKELYIIWNEKTNLLTRSVEWNPFNSSFFAWVDAGYVRYKKYRHDTLAKVIPLDLVHDFQAQKPVQRTLLFSVGETVAAGCYGGFPAAIRLWNQAYYDVLDRMVKEQRFVGKEQDVMSEVVKNNGTDLALLVRPTGPGRWFHMLRFLGGLVSNQTVSLQ